MRQGWGRKFHPYIPWFFTMYEGRSDYRGWRVHNKESQDLRRKSRLTKLAHRKWKKFPGIERLVISDIYNNGPISAQDYRLMRENLYVPPATLEQLNPALTVGLIRGDNQ